MRHLPLVALIMSACQLQPTSPATPGHHGGGQNRPGEITLRVLDSSGYRHQVLRLMAETDEESLWGNSSYADVERNSSVTEGAILYEGGDVKVQLELQDGPDLGWAAAGSPCHWRDNVWVIVDGNGVDVTVDDWGQGCDGWISEEEIERAMN